MKKTYLIILAAFILISPIAAHQSKDSVFVYPESFYALREVYTNDAQVTRPQIDQAYQAAMADAKVIADTGDSLIIQAKCQWIYATMLHTAGDTDQAETCINQAMETITKASKYTQETELYVVWAETISQAIMIKSSTSFTLSEGMKQQKYAKNAYNQQSNYAPAIWIYNCQYAYMPSPFSNHKRALREMTRIIEDPEILKDDWDVYNAGSAIGYVYYAEKNWQKVIEWADFCLSYYPQNSFWIKTRSEAVEKLASR